MRGVDATLKLSKYAIAASIEIKGDVPWPYVHVTTSSVWADTTI